MVAGAADPAPLHRDDLPPSICWAGLRPVDVDGRTWPRLDAAWALADHTAKASARLRLVFPGLRLRASIHRSRAGTRVVIMRLLDEEPSAGRAVRGVRPMRQRSIGLSAPYDVLGIP